MAIITIISQWVVRFLKIIPTMAPRVQAIVRHLTWMWMFMAIITTITRRMVYLLKIVTMTLRIRAINIC
jgi:hypothetical protein